MRITEQFLHSDPPAPEELSDAVSVVRDHLADVDRAVPGAAHAKTLVGLAGTVRTVAAIELGVDASDSERIHHFRLTRAAAEDVFRTLATEPVAAAAAQPGLEPGRVDVIVGGVIVVVAAMRHWGFDEMLVSEADILDGLALAVHAARVRHRATRNVRAPLCAWLARRMTHPERLLLGPGPSNPYPEVIAAFRRPCSGTWTPSSSRCSTRR